MWRRSRCRTRCVGGSWDEKINRNPWENGETSEVEGTVTRFCVALSCAVVFDHTECFTLYYCIFYHKFRQICDCSELHVELDYYTAMSTTTKMRRLGLGLYITRTRHSNNRNTNHYKLQRRKLTSKGDKSQLTAQLIAVRDKSL